MLLLSCCYFYYSNTKVLTILLLSFVIVGGHCTTGGCCPPQHAVCLWVCTCGLARGWRVYAVQRGRCCMDINHQEKHGPVVSAVDGWGVSTVMSLWQMDWPCWQRLAHRLSFQLVPHPRTHLTHKPAGYTWGNKFNLHPQTSLPPDCCAPAHVGTAL